MSTFATTSDPGQDQDLRDPVSGNSRGRIALLLCLLAFVCAATVWCYHIWFRTLVEREVPILSPLTSDVVHKTSAWTTLKLFLTLGTASLAAIFAALRGVCPRRLSALAMKHRRIGIGATILVGVALVLWFGLALRGAPSSEDDLTYFFQARLFANGKIMLPTHTWGPLSDAFEWWWTTHGTRGLCSYQFPGHSLLLVLGGLVGLFSIVPILQAMITSYATYRAALLLYGRRTAVLAVILMVTSPYMLTVFSSYSASTSAACAVSLALWAWAVVLQRGSIRAAFLLGASIGLLCWIRPPTATFVAIPLGGLLLIRMSRGQLSWKTALAGLSTSVPLIALYLGYCAHVTGHFSLSPGNVYLERSSEYGLSKLVTPSDSPVDTVLPSEIVSVARLNMYLYGWPFSLALLVVLPFVTQRRIKTWILLLAALLVMVFYSMYRNVVGWYYFEVGPIWFILGARGLVLLHRWFSRHHPQSAWRSVFPRLIVAAILLSCCHTIPLALAREWSYVRVFNEAPREVCRQLAGQRAAVLIDKSVWPQLRFQLLGMNRPYLDGRIVYVDARDRDWTQEQLSALAGPRQMYYLRYRKDSSHPLKLEATDGKELGAVTELSGRPK